MSISCIFCNLAKHFKLYSEYFLHYVEVLCIGIPYYIHCMITFPERGSKLCLKPHQSDHLKLTSFRVSRKCAWDLPILGPDGLPEAHPLHPALFCSGFLIWPSPFYCWRLSWASRSVLGSCPSLDRRCHYHFWSLSETLFFHFLFYPKYWIDPAFNFLRHRRCMREYYNTEICW